VVFTERKLAGRALMQEVLTLIQLQHEKETVVASIGGFDLAFDGQRLGRDGYHYTTVLQRTGAAFEIELSMTVTPLGAVARLEHALSNFEGERETYQHRLADARKRLASYGARIGEAFAFEAELDLKRAELATIETELAATSEGEAKGAGEARRIAA
jgi:hypothetical protein